jgi:hypothetical protein
MSVGIQIAKGSADPAAARTATVPLGGSRVIAEVLMARNRTMAFEAEPGVGLSFSSSAMALSPKGVAALPRPKMLDAMFITMAPIAGWSAGTSGNKRRSRGARPRAMASRRPASKATRISPSMNTMMPTRPITSVTASLALS